MLNAVHARELSDNNNAKDETHVVSEIARIECIIATNAKDGKEFVSVAIINLMGTDYEDCIAETINQIQNAGYKVERRDDILDINWEK